MHMKPGATEYDGAPLSAARCGEPPTWLERLGSFSAFCEERAAEADESSSPHPAVLKAFHAFGVLMAPFSSQSGGRDLLDPESWELFFHSLRTLGGADLSIGRLFEGHANAIDLVGRYGTPSQIEALASAVSLGAMTGVWGADGKNALHMRKLSNGWILEGGKILASGAGYVARPLVTTTSDAGQRLVLLDLAPGERVDLSAWTPLGMRSSATGSIDLTGIALRDESLIGEPGDFMRQPHFSGGAWRFCAVHLGAIERLVDLFREQLRARQRGEDPYQLQRIATCISSAGTAAMWIKAAARQLALGSGEIERCIALSNVTRGVTERAALDVMESVQRGVGLTSFMRPNPIERVGRDLATYLLQPVPDLAMTDAARFALATYTPVRDLWGFDAN